jgi:hypothetical protein
MGDLFQLPDPTPAGHENRADEVREMADSFSHTTPEWFISKAHVLATLCMAQALAENTRAIERHRS